MPRASSADGPELLDVIVRAGRNPVLMVDRDLMKALEEEVINNRTKN